AGSAPITQRATPVLIEEPRSNGSSTFFTALLFLILGAVGGVAGYYFLWPQPQPEPPAVQAPAITEMKSTNAPLTAFEEGRRLVDKDPAAYINANAAAAREVDDYFLLGRAFMLAGKYWEAKRSFQEARNRLATADPNNARTLANEISMALAIIESPQATESFGRDVATANAAGTSNTNTNTNTSTANAAAPR
ncbi:MAG TPA: hypothetical protein VNA22_09665, partial [Pyrinomonadaceae bacterium]|nr:hypothetical protein [Pyrinomonadaceae bacterium]